MLEITSIHTTDHFVKVRFGWVKYRIGDEIFFTNPNTAGPVYPRGIIVRKYRTKQQIVTMDRIYITRDLDRSSKGTWSRLVVDVVVDNKIRTICIGDVRLIQPIPIEQLLLHPHEAVRQAGVILYQRQQTWLSQLKRFILKHFDLAD